MGLAYDQAAQLVKRAKDGGCMAFDQRGCVDMPKLRKWIGDNKDTLSVPAPMSLKDQKLNEEIRKLRNKNDREEKLFVLKARVIEAEDRFAAADDSILEQCLVNEYPSIVAGLEPAQVRVYGQRLWDRIRAERQKLSVLWKGL